jgi:hypothetical protein
MRPEWGLEMMEDAEKRGQLIRRLRMPWYWRMKFKAPGI